MKKKSALIVLFLSMLLLAGGCNTKNNLEGKNVNATPTPAEGTENTEGTDAPAGTEEEVTYEVNDLVREEYNLDDYIKLGKYKGIEITVDKLEVTDADIDVAIQSDLKDSGAELVEVKDRAVQTGDSVNIDYEGLKDGVAFEGGTAKGFDLLIGSGAFIEGFEDRIIGAKAGDKLELDITFPENYSSADLAGQPVVFKVTVNNIQRYELTEDYVTTNTDYDSIDAYKAGLSDRLTADKEAAIEAKKANDVYTAVVDNSEISSLPQTLLDYFANDLRVFYTNYAKSYGMELADFLSASGTTEEDFDLNAQDYAKSMATRELVMSAVAKAENIELSEEEFQAGVEKYATDYGYGSTEEFLKNADEVLLREDIFYNKITDFIVAEAIVK